MLNGYITALAYAARMEGGEVKACEFYCDGHGGPPGVSAQLRLSWPPSVMNNNSRSSRPPGLLRHGMDGCVCCARRAIAGSTGATTLTSHTSR